MGGRVLITSTPKAGNPYAPLLEMAPAPDGLDPAVLDWAALAPPRWLRHYQLRMRRARRGRLS